MTTDELTFCNECGVSNRCAKCHAAGITKTVDRFGRTWLLIDDDRARALRGWIKAHWTEIPGVGHGYSADITPESEWFDLCASLDTAALLARDRLAFIAGRSFPIDNPRAEPAAYELLVSTSGCRRGPRQDCYRFDG